MSIISWPTATRTVGNPLIYNTLAVGVKRILPTFKKCGSLHALIFIAHFVYVIAILYTEEKFVEGFFDTGFFKRFVQSCHTLLDNAAFTNSPTNTQARVFVHLLFGRNNNTTKSLFSVSETRNLGRFARARASRVYSSELSTTRVRIHSHVVYRYSAVKSVRWNFINYRSNRRLDRETCVHS